MQVRCLSCHEPIEVSQDSDLSALSCSSCGSDFNLVGEQTISYRQVEAHKVGRFELIDEVGIGAFGSVWMARDPGYRSR